ncbi:hypothetical protein LCGC14_1773820 [marine sediment metagenome]|uniref:Uncharacterized protein n=1 Tax=marine sediment metagenome TaxID=412755 RepID=A0A0F9HJY6_9ZZZZ
MVSWEWLPVAFGLGMTAALTAWYWGRHRD